MTSSTQMTNNVLMGVETSEFCMNVNGANVVGKPFGR